MYSPQVLDHFEHPRNSGELPDATVSAQLENPGCGDVLRLMLKVSDGRITAARFLAKGCVPSMACGSQLTEMIQGRTVAEARAMKREELVNALGGLPEASAHAAHLAIAALAETLGKLTS